MSPNERTIKTLQARQEIYSDCIDLLIGAINDFATAEGVEGFNLCPSYSRTETDVCFLENHSQADMGSLFESRNEQSIAAFLGMIAQAKTMKGGA